MGGTLSARTAACLKHQSHKAPGSREIPEFSDKEKRIIRITWARLEQKTPQVAADIFLRIFELRPEVKAFFPFRSAVGEALVSHSYFKGHAMRFLNAVGMTVANMDAWEVIHIPNLRKLGYYHTKIPGFTHDIFEVFYDAMNDVWRKYLGRSYSSETRSIWCKIFRFIVDQVELGYQEAVAEGDKRTAGKVSLPAEDSQTSPVHSHQPSPAHNHQRSPVHTADVRLDTKVDTDTTAASPLEGTAQPQHSDGGNHRQNETENGNTKGGRSAVNNEDITVNGGEVG